MSNEALYSKRSEAIWIARSLFDRGKATGSSANLSFLHDGKVYITSSGGSFGRLDDNSFSVISMAGEQLDGPKPSKELPLHLMVYQANPDFHAVIHTHSIYATLWSCFVKGHEDNAVPRYTPYLQMKLGDIRLIPYAPPGSQKLFELFAQRVDARGGYLLRNHGPVVAADSCLSAFYALEELEEACRIAWELRHESIEEIE